MMRKQRLAYTLPMQNDFIIPPEQEDVRNIFQSQFQMQATESSQFFATPDLNQNVPYFLNQYPVIPSQYPSVTSIMSNQSFRFNPYDNFENLGQLPLKMENAYNLSPILDSGYGDCALPCEMYSPEEPPKAQFDLMSGIFRQGLPISYPIMTNYGTLTVLLRHLIKVDVTEDESVFLTNFPSESAAVVNSNGHRSGLIHPNGRVFQDTDEIHMTTLDKTAKISNRGVVFTSKNHCLSYLVDASGTKTTNDKFRDLSHDFSDSIFNIDSSEPALERCHKMAEESVHKTFKNGDEVWMLGGIRIKQDKWGDVKVSRFPRRMVIKTSPTTGRISINTQDVDIALSRYHDNYFSVRKGIRCVTASLKGFNVQNGSQRAGFSRSCKLVIK